jgi:glyoxylate reductase
MIGSDEFNMMKPTAVFINTSRGPVIDQKALYEALASKKIFSAAIDVTETEPIAGDDPLLGLENIIIAPHIASASFVTRRNIAVMAAKNLIAGLQGKIPPNCVNPEVFE